MSVSSTTARVSASGNGTTVVFPYSQYFLAAADLVVILRVDSTGVETTQTITTHYTVTGDGDSNGGSVTMVTAPATGESLIIYNDPDATQTLNLVENDDLPAESVETAMDRNTLLIQRTKDRLDRAVTLSEGFTASFDTTLPELLVASTTILVNASADGFITGPTATEISNAETNASSAATSATAAAASSASASTAETNASASETAASTATTNASTAETNASASETAASTAATNASTAETNASASETAASTAETNASTAATNASTAETNSSQSETDSSTAETNASASETAASTAETNASASAASVAFTIVAVQAVTSGGDVSHSADMNQVRRVKSSGGALVASTTPFGTVTTNFTDGMQIFLEGESDTDTLEIQHNDATSGCLLNGNIILDKGANLNLRYNASLARFTEVSRNR